MWCCHNARCAVALAGHPQLSTAAQQSKNIGAGYSQQQHGPTAPLTAHCGKHSISHRGLRRRMCLIARHRLSPRRGYLYAARLPHVMISGTSRSTLCATLCSAYDALALPHSRVQLRRTARTCFLAIAARIRKGPLSISNALHWNRAARSVPHDRALCLVVCTTTAGMHIAHDGM